MKNLVRNILNYLTLTLLILVSAPGALAADSLKALSEECRDAIWSRRYDKLRSDGERLRDAAVKAGDTDMEQLGEAFSLRGLVCTRTPVDSVTAERAITISRRMTEKGDTTSLPFFYLQTALSHYYLYDSLDYQLALESAYHALRCAERMQDKDLESDALNLLTAVYFLKQDDRGWEYAVRNDRLTRSTSNYSGMYAASLNMANYLYNRNQFDEALRYLLVGRDLMDKGKVTVSETYISAFLGDVYAKLGKDREAERSYTVAVTVPEPDSDYDKGYARMCYAEFLSDRGRTREAIQQLALTENAIDTLYRPNYYVHLLLQQAQTYERGAEPRQALEYYKKYIREQARLVTAAKEKDIDRLEARYKIMEAQNHNMRQSLELAGKRRMLTIAWTVVVLLLLIALFLWVLNRRTKRYYREIVDRTLENLKRQSLIEKQLKEALVSAGQRPSTGAEGERGEELFARIKRLMEEEQVYRDPALSIETLATMAATNRTYLSRVINERAGMPYAAFVNDYRLKEIIRALSDPENGKTLKEIGHDAGFATMANFYRLFKERVGVSPAVFRKNALETKSASPQNGAAPEESASNNVNL